MAREINTATVSSGKKKLVSFRYEALAGPGKTVKGKLKAEGEIEAERILVEMNLRPVIVEPVPSMFSMEEALPTFFGVKPRDVIVFSRQLSTLLRSGVSLLPALEILAGQATTGRAFKKVLESMAIDLRGGSSFSQTLYKHPKVFSDIYSRTLAVGEQSGSLDNVLLQMAEYLEKQGAVTKKIGGALSYPLTILGVGVVVSVILMTVVMPKLLSLFVQMNVELPLPTRILMGMTDFFSNNILVIIAVVSIASVAFVWMLRQPRGRRFFDRVRLKMPVIGTPVLLTELARFSRSASVLLGAGLSLQEIMEIVPQAISNSHVRKSLQEVNERLILGEGLSDPMSRHDLFPSLLVQMVAVGEESNTLDYTLGVVADFYETTADEKIHAMTGMIGPMATMFIAILVGFIAISVLMPMYTITGSFG